MSCVGLIEKADHVQSDNKIGTADVDPSINQSIHPAARVEIEGERDCYK
jgi:hypothetical protein